MVLQNPVKRLANESGHPSMGYTWIFSLAQASFFSDSDSGRDPELATSGMEGLNSKAKVTTRKSYGFRTYCVLELALYRSLGKLSEPDGHSRFLLTSRKTSPDKLGISAPGKTKKASVT
jgi:hypothetical protein